MKARNVALLMLTGALLAGGAIVVKRARTPALEVAATLPSPSADTGTKGQVRAGIPAIELTASDLAVVETREVRRELPLTGQLRPTQQALLRAKVAGEVVEMRVKEGDSVAGGQVLARIDPAEYRARLDERLASLAANKATWENNERTRKNNEELLRKAFISQQAYDNTLANSSVAEAQVKAAQANVTLAQKSLDDTWVKAPWAGTIAERLAQVGDRAAVDTRLLSLVDVSRMELEAAVPASDIPSVAVGQEVAFKVEGFGERAFRGRIARVAPQSAAGSRSILVYVNIPNNDGALKGGMFAKGNLTLSRRESVTAVPIAALREERGETVVYALEGEKLARLPVRTGTRNDEEAWAEVVSGIGPGTWVIKSNLGALNAGAAVRVMDAPAQPALPATSAAPTPAPGAPPAKR